MEDKNIIEDYTLFIKVKDHDGYYQVAGAWLGGFSKEHANILSEALVQIQQIIEKDRNEHDPLFAGWITHGQYIKAPNKDN